MWRAADALAKLELQTPPMLKAFRTEQFICLRRLSIFRRRTKATEAILGIVWNRTHTHRAIGRISHRLAETAGETHSDLRRLAVEETPHADSLPMAHRRIETSVRPLYSSADRFASIPAVRIACGGVVLAVVKTVCWRCSNTHHRLPHPTLRSPSFIFFFLRRAAILAVSIAEAASFCSGFTGF